MGNPYWMGMMMGHAWNLLLLGLGIGMGKHAYYDYERPELTLTERATTATTTATTKTTTTITIEDYQMLAESLGITISVGCVPKTIDKRETPDLQRRQEISKITCGSGFKCDSNSCGSGAKPASAKITNVPLKSGGSRCHSFTNVQCSKDSWLDRFCKKYVTNYGSYCPGVYDQINFFGKSYCLDFCCHCPSVFYSCKCNCCKCLNNTGGTCGNTECNIDCPGSELINKQTNKDIL